MTRVPRKAMDADEIVDGEVGSPVSALRRVPRSRAVPAYGPRRRSSGAAREDGNFSHVDGRDRRHHTIITVVTARIIRASRSWVVRVYVILA